MVQPHRGGHARGSGANARGGRANARGGHNGGGGRGEGDGIHCHWPCCIDPACPLLDHKAEDLQARARILAGPYPDLPLGGLITASPHADQSYALCVNLEASLLRLWDSSSNMYNEPVSAHCPHPIQPRRRLDELKEAVRTKKQSAANNGADVDTIAVRGRKMCEAVCKVRGVCEGGTLRSACVGCQSVVALSCNALSNPITTSWELLTHSCHTHSSHSSLTPPAALRRCPSTTTCLRPSTRPGTRMRGS